jgi:hypothetical protein
MDRRGAALDEMNPADLQDQPGLGIITSLLHYASCLHRHPWYRFSSAEHTEMPMQQGPVEPG